MTAESSTGEGLAAALAGVPVTRALVARARGGREVLPDALRARGADVDVLELYETVVEPLAPETLAQARAADYVTFTSSSTVRNFLRAAGGGEDAAGHDIAARDGRARAGLSPHTRIVSIGPVTSETLREHGIDVDVEAARHDVDGLLDALLADATAQEP